MHVLTSTMMLPPAKPKICAAPNKSMKTHYITVFLLMHSALKLEKSEKNIICDFKNGKKSIFVLGKSLKLSKCNFTRKIVIYLISRVFLPELF